MDNIVEIVLQAIDNASNVFSSVSESANEIGTSMESAATEASTGFDEIDSAASGATGTIQDVIDYCQGIDGSGPRDAAGGMDELYSATSEADTAVEDLGSDLDIINAGMLLQTAEQIGAIAGNAEGMAQEMNTAAISVGQLATQTGIAEPQMVDLISTISNATFPQEEAMLYVKSLDQIGVSSENLGKSATDLDRINDAFGLGAQKTNSLGNELSVLGVDMNNVSDAFNALAYANANTVGGMDNYFTFLRKYDAQFKELNIDVDQASIIISAATKKYGGGRAALSGLSDALKEADGDTRKLEEALGIQSGTLDHASEVTGEYEGTLMDLASEEAEHKTLLDQIGAAWEDMSLKLTPVLEPLMSFVGLIGQVGSFGLQVQGLKTLASTARGAIGWIEGLNIVQGISAVLSGEAATAATVESLALEYEAVAAGTAETGFIGLAAAEGLALWPILAIIAAIGLLVLAVYEIGKAFGWWSDVGSMLDAIKSGIMRLWNAFVNHPDVQAAISTISGALSTLWGWIVQAGQAVLDFFNINQSGNFDIVRAIIDTVGAAWGHVHDAIMVVVGIVETVIDTFNTVVEYFQAFGSQVSGIWSVIVGIVSPYINQIVGFVQGLINVFNQFRSGQMDLPTFIITILSTLWNAYLNVTMQISNLILKWAGQLLTYAVNAGRNFINGILNYIRQLPSRIYSYLQSVVARIQQAITLWKNKAIAMVNELIQRIVSPFQGVANSITSALSGVANALMKPFQDAWTLIKPYYDKIKGAIDSLGNLNPFAGGPEEETATSTNGQNFNINTGEYIVNSTDEPIKVEYTVNLNLDLENVPTHINTGDLINALSDKKVITALTGNRDFQDMDAKVKSRIRSKTSRAKGV